MGVLAPGSTHARPSARPPIDTSGNFLAHMSAESHSNISPNPSKVKSEVIHFCGSNKNLKKPKNRPPGGQGVGVRIFFLLPEFLFILVRSPCKVSNSYDMPLLGFSNGGRREKRKEKKSMIIVVPSSDRLTAWSSTLGPISQYQSCLHVRLDTDMCIPVISPCKTRYKYWSEGSACDQRSKLG